MDKKLLDSLNNLSIALQEISDALKSKGEATSATAKAMKGGDFIKEIKEINIGVKQLQKDTKQILSNQQTIMKMGKSKSKGADVAEGLGKDKQKQNNFKEGIGVILLLAVAVLALGIAFNLVGKVNFLSVIALSIALPLLAIGFAKVHTVLKQVGFDAKKDSKNFIIAITAISLGITISSWILSMVTPVTFTKMFTIILIGVGFSALSPAIYKLIRAFKGMSFMEVVKSVLFLPMILPAIALGIAFASWAFQLVKPVGFNQMFTTIFIALAFTVISFGIRKLLKAFKGIPMESLAKSVLFLPLILPAIALGIALSSYALQLVKPISVGQFFTTIFIALAFTIIAFGIRKLMGAFKGLTPVEMLVAAIGIPVILVAISYAIALSSHALSMVKPIGFSQFLTSIGIALVFVVISVSAKLIINAVSKMKPQDVFKLPVFFVAVSLAIWLSSEILSRIKVIDSTKMFKMAAFSVVLAIAVVAVGGAMFALNKMGIGVKDAIMGSLLIVIVSLAIMLSSQILAMGNYKKYPDWKWALGVGLSLLAFIPAIIALGFIAISGIGAIAMAAGAIAILGVAATIVATSKILAKGKYSQGPPLSWSLGVGLVMTGFGMAILLLGSFIVGTLGFGWIALKAGAKAVNLVAESIVDASIILQRGKYVGGPTKEWAEGIAIALGAFAPVYSMLMNSGILSIFGVKGVSPKDFATAIITVSGGIIDAAKFFSKNSVAFKNGPSKAWSEGVGLAIGAFAPVYKMLVDFPFSGGKKMSAAIVTISKGIIESAEIFGKNKSKFDEGNYPSVKWGRGVGAALSAFAPVFKSLSEDTGWFTSGEEVINNMVNGVVRISRAIVRVGYIFAKSNLKWDSYPSKKWGWNVRNAIGSFITLSKNVGTEDDINYDGVIKSASEMSRVAGILWKSKKFFKSNIDPSYIKNMTTNVKDFSKLVKYLSKDNLSGGVLSAFGLDPASRAAQGMSKMASAFDKLATSLNRFSSSIKSVDGQKVNMIRSLTGNIAILSSMDSKMFNNMMTVLESRSSTFSKLLDAPRRAGSPNVGEKPGGGQREVWARKSNQGPTDGKGESALQKLDRIAHILNSINKNVDTVDDLVSHLMSQKKEEKLGTEK
jgi:hypothetical protein